MLFFCVSQECPCLVDGEFLASLQSVSVAPVSSALYNISEGTELQSGDILAHECSIWWLYYCPASFHIVFYCPQWPFGGSAAPPICVKSLALVPIDSVPAHILTVLPAFSLQWLRTWEVELFPGALSCWWRPVTLGTMEPLFFVLWRTGSENSISRMHPTCPSSRRQRLPGTTTGNHLLSGTWLPRYRLLSSSVVFEWGRAGHQGALWGFRKLEGRKEFIFIFI